MGRRILASQRWQWVGLGTAATFAVLRVILDGYLWPTVVLLCASLVLGMFFIAIVAPRAWSEMADGWGLRDAWKPLSRADRKIVRLAVRERTTLRPDLLVPAEVYARARTRNGERLPWTLAGFAMISTSASWYPWSLIVVALALALGAVVVIRGSRWRRDYLAVVEQQHAAVE